MNSAQYASPPQVGGVGNEHTGERGTVCGPGGGPPGADRPVLAGQSMLIDDARKSERCRKSWVEQNETGSFSGRSLGSFNKQI